MMTDWMNRNNKKRFIEKFDSNLSKTCSHTHTSSIKVYSNYVHKWISDDDDDDDDNDGFCNKLQFTLEFYTLRRALMNICIFPINSHNQNQNLDEILCFDNKQKQTKKKKQKVYI